MSISWRNTYKRQIRLANFILCNPAYNERPFMMPIFVDCFFFAKKYWKKNMCWKEFVNA